VVTGEPSSIFDGSIPISDPWVMVDNGVYKMWFTSVTGQFTSEQVVGDDRSNWKASSFLLRQQREPIQ